MSLVKKHLLEFSPAFPRALLKQHTGRTFREAFKRVLSMFFKLKNSGFWSRDHLPESRKCIALGHSPYFTPHMRKAHVSDTPRENFNVF